MRSLRLTLKAGLLLLVLSVLPSYSWLHDQRTCPAVPAKYWNAAAAGAEAAATMEARGEYLRAYDTRALAARDQRIAEAIEATRAKLGCSSG